MDGGTVLGQVVCPIIEPWSTCEASKNGNQSAYPHKIAPFVLEVHTAACGMEGGAMRGQYVCPAARATHDHAVDQQLCLLSRPARVPPILPTKRSLTDSTDTQTAVIRNPSHVFPRGTSGLLRLSSSSPSFAPHITLSGADISAAVPLQVRYGKSLSLLRIRFVTFSCWGIRMLMHPASAGQHAQQRPAAPALRAGMQRPGALPAQATGRPRMPQQKPAAATWPNC